LYRWRDEFICLMKGDHPNNKIPQPNPKSCTTYPQEQNQNGFNKKPLVRSNI
jgi:hypothetical protein